MKSSSYSKKINCSFLIYFHNDSTNCILWSPPVGNTKLILMGAVFRPQQAAGYIVIIGDSEGRTIGALSLWIPLPQTVEEVEVLACC